MTFRNPDEIKNKYPSLTGCTYLNTAYTGVVSSSLMEWRKATDHNYAVEVDRFKNNQAVVMETNAQLQVARLMHTEVDQVFLASSCSDGLQAFLFKIPRDYKFLLLQDDYPAITQMVADHQFDYTEIPLKTELEVSVLEELRQNKYEVFAFSAVQYNSGLLFDMEFLHTIKEEFPSLIILVDGTQFIGAESFDFDQSAVDGIFGSGYKWLLASYGNGFMCLKKSLLLQLNSSKEEVLELLDRGHKSPLAMGSLGFAIEELFSFDMEALLRKKKELAVYFFEALKERNLLEDFVCERKEHSSIFTLKISDKTHQALIKENIRCVKRGVGVRVSVHFYNTHQDVDHLLEMIDRATTQQLLP